MRNRRLIASVLVMTLALLGGAMLLLNFKAASSQTRAEASVATATAGSAEGVRPGAASLFLFVEGDDALESALRSELEAALSEGPRFAGVTVLDRTSVVDEYPALAVGISDHDVLWTPLYGRSMVVTRFSFASDRGNVSWRDESPLVIEADATVRSRGQIETRDETWGLISRPAYLEHLAQAAAVQVAGQLEQALDGAATGP